MRANVAVGERGVGATVEAAGVGTGVEGRGVAGSENKVSVGVDSCDVGEEQPTSRELAKRRDKIHPKAVLILTPYQGSGYRAGRFRTVEPLRNATRQEQWGSSSRSSLCRSVPIDTFFRSNAFHCRCVAVSPRTFQRFAGGAGATRLAEAGNTVKLNWTWGLVFRAAIHGFGERCEAVRPIIGGNGDLPGPSSTGGRSCNRGRPSLAHIRVRGVPNKRVVPL